MYTCSCNCDIHYMCNIHVHVYMYCVHVHIHIKCHGVYSGQNQLTCTCTCTYTCGILLMLEIRLYNLLNNTQQPQQLLEMQFLMYPACVYLLKSHSQTLTVLTPNVIYQHLCPLGYMYMYTFFNSVHVHVHACWLCKMHQFPYNHLSAFKHIHVTMVLSQRHLK